MFILRSLFWLTAAFIVIAPHGMDVAESAKSTSATLAANGQRALVEKLDGVACDSLECSAGKAVISAAATQSISRLIATEAPGLAGAPRPDATSAPLPPPRPDWAL